MALKKLDICEKQNRTEQNQYAWAHCIFAGRIEHKAPGLSQGNPKGTKRPNNLLQAPVGTSL